MSEEAPPADLAGEEIELATGAKVALFRDAAPGAHGIRFTSAEGVVTRVALSDAALSALVALALRGTARVAA